MVANAIRVRGSRSLKQAEIVGPVGRPRGTRSSEASLFPVQLVGAVFITAQLARSEGGSTVFVGLHARRGLVRVTEQEHAYGRLRDRLFDLGRIARGRGFRSLGPLRGLSREGMTAWGRPRPLRRRDFPSSTRGPGQVTTKDGSSTGCATSRDVMDMWMGSPSPPAATSGMR